MKNSAEFSTYIYDNDAMTLVIIIFVFSLDKTLFF
jgi:hypothetical protein